MFFGSVHGQKIPERVCVPGFIISNHRLPIPMGQVARPLPGRRGFLIFFENQEIPPLRLAKSRASPGCSLAQRLRALESR